MFWFADSFCLLQAGVSSSQNSEFQAAASSADVIASGRQRHWNSGRVCRCHCLSCAHGGIIGTTVSSPTTYALRTNGSTVPAWLFARVPYTAER